MRFRLFFLLIIVLCTTFHPAQAESNSIPLYLLLSRDASQDATDNPPGTQYYVAGDLWRWDGGSDLTQVTHWGFNHVPVISPDGKMLVYQSAAQITIDYLNSDASHAAGGSDGALPINLWLMDAQSNQSLRIADQKADARINFDAFYIDNGLARSMPAWSPDGQKIAWIEDDSINALVHGDTFDPYVMVYDLRTQKTQTLIPDLKITNYGTPDAGGTALGDMTFFWTDAGLVVGYLGYDEEHFAYMLYDLSGKLLSETNTPNDRSGTRLTGWVSDGTQNFLGIHTIDGWTLYDLRTGKDVPLKGVVEAYNPLSPEGAALRVDTDNIWELVTASNSTEQLTSCYAEDMGIAVSPDGQMAACTDSANQAVDIYNASGLVTTLPIGDKGLLGISWGNLAWRVNPS